MGVCGGVGVRVERAIHEWGHEYTNEEGIQESRAFPFSRAHLHGLYRRSLR
jgi:hypothetical protein